MADFFFFYVSDTWPNFRNATPPFPCYIQSACDIRKKKSCYPLADNPSEMLGYPFNLSDTTSTCPSTLYDLSLIWAYSVNRIMHCCHTKKWYYQWWNACKIHVKIRSELQIMIVFLKALIKTVIITASNSRLSDNLSLHLVIRSIFWLRLRQMGTLNVARCVQKQYCKLQSKVSLNTKTGICFIATFKNFFKLAIYIHCIFSNKHPRGVDISQRGGGGVFIWGDIFLIKIARKYQF